MDTCERQYVFDVQKETEGLGKNKRWVKAYGHNCWGYVYKLILHIPKVDWDHMVDNTTLHTADLNACTYVKYLLANRYECEFNIYAGNANKLGLEFDRNPGNGDMIVGRNPT